MGQRLGGVFGGHLDQVPLVPPPRHLEHHLVAPPAAQPFLDDQGLVDLVGQQDLGGDVGCFVVELLDKRGHDADVCLLSRTIQDKVLATDEPPVADEKDLHTGVAVGAGKGYDILVGHGRRDDLLALDDAPDGVELVAVEGRLLKVPLFGSGLHFCFQAGYNLVGFALQEAAQAIDHVPVLVLARGADARSQAQADVQIEAGPLVLTGDGPAAGEVGKDAPQGVERLLYRPGGGKGAIVAGAIPLHAAHDEDPGKVFLPGDLDVRIALVVLEPDVVLGLVALDEVALEDQGLQFGGGDDKVDVVDAGHQALDLGALAGRGVKVGAHPGAQVDRLADVEDRALGVLHQIDARLGGQGVEFFLQVLGCVARHGDYSSTDVARRKSAKLVYLSFVSSVGFPTHPVSLVHS